MKRYRFTMPTPERCRELGIKFEGLEVRTRFWLMGVAAGVSYMSSHVPIEREIVRCDLAFTTKTSFSLSTNSDQVIAQVSDYLLSYGFTMTEMA